MKEYWKIKHGMYGTRTYNCWISMKKRCSDKGNASFKNYGAKGIKVCERLGYRKGTIKGRKRMRWADVDCVSTAVRSRG